jgi:hypothetical protein
MSIGVGPCPRVNRHAIHQLGAPHDRRAGVDASVVNAACRFGGVLMLGIGALGASSAAYYLETVASGREDYYLGAGEAPGVWLGAHAATLGLERTVEPAALHAVLEGVDPATGARLDRARVNRAPGFDLTFSAPKSVSILHALADPEIVSRYARRTITRSLPRSDGWNATRASFAAAPADCSPRRVTGSSRRDSGIGPAVPVIPISIPTSWSRT